MSTDQRWVRCYHANRGGTPVVVVIDERDESRAIPFDSEAERMMLNESRGVLHGPDGVIPLLGCFVDTDAKDYELGEMVWEVLV